MKKFITFWAFMLLIPASIAFAVEPAAVLTPINLEFAYPSSDVDGFRLFQDGVQVADITPPTLRKVILTVPLKETDAVFVLVGYKAGRNGKPSPPYILKGAPTGIPSIVKISVTN